MYLLVEVLVMALKNMTQKIKNCAQCGRIFAPLRNEVLCRDCRIKEEEKQQEVLEYVRDHQGSTIKEVMEALGVTDKFIKQMIKEGLFVNIEREDFYYPCKVCGKPIRNGTYCSDCLSKLRNETKKMAEHMALKVTTKDGEKRKPISQMSTIEKLNAQAERELERENRSFSRGMYADIVSRNDKRTIGKYKKK